MGTALLIVLEPYLILGALWQVCIQTRRNRHDTGNQRRAGVRQRGVSPKISTADPIEETDVRDEVRRMTYR
jgi:hypothetical protein